MSVLNMHFRKLLPKLLSYRNFSNYDIGNFTKSLNEVLNKYENQKYQMVLIAVIKYALKF